MDDLDDLDDLVEAGPSWFDCPTLHPDEMLATIKRNGNLDGRSLNLFSALERPPRSDLFELYLRENLYRPGSHYIYVSPDPTRYGFGYWRPVVTKAAFEDESVRPCALFSNCSAAIWMGRQRQSGWESGVAASA
jgi:hypothetical protein